MAIGSEVFLLKNFETGGFYKTKGWVVTINGWING